MPLFLAFQLICVLSANSAVNCSDLPAVISVGLPFTVTVISAFFLLSGASSSLYTIFEASVSRSAMVTFPPSSPPLSSSGAETMLIRRIRLFLGYHSLPMLQRDPPSPRYS